VRPLDLDEDIEPVKRESEMVGEHDQPVGSTRSFLTSLGGCLATASLRGDRPVAAGSPFCQAVPTLGDWV
jgi:hypothetical protein